jgi:hypothetical protein
MNYFAAELRGINRIKGSLKALNISIKRDIS